MMFIKFNADEWELLTKTVVLRANVVFFCGGRLSFEGFGRWPLAGLAF